MIPICNETVLSRLITNLHIQYRVVSKASECILRALESSMLVGTQAVDAFGTHHSSLL